MKCEKPEFTEEMRKKLNYMYLLLKERFYSKQELMDIFNTGERQVRMMITEVSHIRPVISTSGTNMGYKIATTKRRFRTCRKLLGQNFHLVVRKLRNELNRLLLSVKKLNLVNKN